MDAIEMARLEQLERCVPDIWEYEKYLYIGAGEYRHHFFETMQQRALMVDVVESDAKNFGWLLSHDWLNGVVWRDVVEHFEDIKMEPQWDVVLWSHGPSCVEKEKAIKTIKYTGGSAKSIVVLMTPHGNAGGTGNISTWYPEDFEKLGYKTDCLGGRDERNSNLLAWKYIK